MKKKLHMSREYPGLYVSRNASPAVTAERDSDGWTVTWGNHSEHWRSLDDCRKLIETTAALGADATVPVVLT